MLIIYITHVKCQYYNGGIPEKKNDNINGCISLYRERAYVKDSEAY